MPMEGGIQLNQPKGPTAKWVLLPAQGPEDEIHVPQSIKAIGYSPLAFDPTKSGSNNPILDPTTWTQRNPMVPPEFILPTNSSFEIPSNLPFAPHVWDSQYLNKDLFPGLFGQSTGALVPYGSATIPLPTAVAATVPRQL